MSRVMKYATAMAREAGLGIIPEGGITFEELLARGLENLGYEMPIAEGESTFQDITSFYLQQMLDQKKITPEQYEEPR